MNPKKLGLIAAATLLVMQIVPYGCNKANPPVTKNAEWVSPEAERLARAVCYDCHSNETQWPWYSYVAPVSWLVATHVYDGRRHLNFSEWDKPQRHASDSAHEYEEDEMPESFYTTFHADAALSQKDRATLIAALEAVGETAIQPEE